MLKDWFLKYLKDNSESLSEYCDLMILWVKEKEWFDWAVDLWLYWKWSINTTNTPYKDFYGYRDFDYIHCSKVWDGYSIYLKFQTHIQDLWLIDLFEVALYSKDKIQRERLKDQGTITIYWSFFRLKEMNRADFDLFDFLHINLKGLYFKRYDFKIDCWGWKLNWIPSLRKIIEGDIWRFSLFKNEWNKKEDMIGDCSSWSRGVNLLSLANGLWYWYISNGYHNGKKKYKKSPYAFLRIYDKVLDSESKGKDLLYGEYLKYERETNSKIWRVELEFWSMFCEARGEILFEEVEKLEKQIDEFIGRDEKTWRFYKRYDKALKWDLSILSDNQRIQYFKATNTRNERCFAVWYDILFWMEQEIWFDWVVSIIKKYCCTLDLERLERIEAVMQERRKEIQERKLIQ